MILVLDACALVAYLEGEQGGKVVDGLVSDPDNSCFVHAINLCEVYYGVRRGHGESAAQASLEAIEATGLIIREDIDDELWQEAGRIKADYRRISLADCFCAALAARADGEIVTADAEFRPLADGGRRVTFIR